MSFLAGMFLAASLMFLAPDVAFARPTPITGQADLQGYVTYYNPGVMELVTANRGMADDCPECIGRVALLDKVHLGRIVWLQRPDWIVEGPFLVVDCARAVDFARLKAKGMVAEVDWPTSRRWQMRGPVRNVKVFFSLP